MLRLRHAQPLRRTTIAIRSLTSASPSAEVENALKKTPASSPAAAPIPTIYAVNERLFAVFRKIITKRQSETTGAPVSVRADLAKPDASWSLQRKQEYIEKEQRNDAIVNQAKIFDDLKKLGKGTSVKRVQRDIVSWYEPLTAAIHEEIRLIEEGAAGEDRSKYGPYLLLLPVEQLAILALDTVVSSILRSGNSGIPTTTVTLEIGSNIETEVNLRKVKMSKDNEWAKRLLKNKPRESIQVYKKLKKIIKDIDGWSWDTKAKIGAVMIKLMLNNVRNEKGESIFHYTSSFNVSLQKKQGLIKIAPEKFPSLNTSVAGIFLPRFLPMLVPPKPWDNKEYYGAYLLLKAPLMKHSSKSQMDAVRKANMKPVLEGLDYLGKTAWRINNDVLNTVLECQKRGLKIGEIPSNNDLEIVDRETFVDKFISNGNLKLKSTDPALIEREIDFLYRQWTGRVERKNSELHSLRCDLQIKVSIAEQFMNQRIYFPHNLDFRGRAYPIPPNLSHLGSDMCRGLLLFDDEKMLGHEGLKWLKVHLANLWGNNKVSFDERVEWVDANMDKIRESARNPLEGEMWWAQAENPFQALATCIELANAMELDDPTRYKSRLPVHQDGSCNGLQHYAGLGRDAPGGRAVNLSPSQSPQDVYTRVLEIVKRHIEEDTNIPDDSPDPKMLERKKLAMFVRDLVNRKVIKQTVMTSVYGVTKIGARQQVQARLTELFTDDSTVLSMEQDKKLYLAANYVAGLTLVSLHEMFDSAKKIMDWLAVVSQMVSHQGQTMSWITPLGLPVTQPYRREAHYAVKTVLQNVILTLNNDFLPVASKKQKSAFPPNYVHSLDATHMLMTCLKMKEQKLTFAAVHDSYWTHASDVGKMNEVLRKSFVELYNYPILEELRESIEIRFPDLEVPPIPQRGELDIELVKDSEYFFH